MRYFIEIFDGTEVVGCFSFPLRETAVNYINQMKELGYETKLTVLPED